MSDGDGGAATETMIEAGAGAASYQAQVLPHLHYRLQHQAPADVHEGALSDGRLNLAALHERAAQFGDAAASNLYRAAGPTMSTFKSAPDIRRLQPAAPMMDVTHSDYNERLTAPCDEHNLELLASAQSGRQSGGPRCERPISLIVDAKTPRGRSNLSTYAVPLCATVRRPPQQQQQQRHQRQCQSCPSSLRRKRRLPARPDAAASNWPGASCTNMGALAAEREPHCSCLNCNRPATLMPWPVNQNSWLAAAGSGCACLCAAQLNGPCYNCELAYANLAPAGQSCWPPVQHQMQHHCHLNLAPLHYGGQRAGEAHHRQLNYSFRSHSSQSNRSAVHYGLYESEAEDEDDNDIDDDDDDDDDAGGGEGARHQDHQEASAELVEEALFAGANSARQLHAGGGGQNRDSFSRSHSAHFRPAIIKPVHGYDQTLARATLKSRQRSRSQPPGSSAEAQNSFHLTKSMENVEKLIKEVQNELRALKRQPLGAVQIDLSSVPAAVGRASVAPKVGHSASGEYGNLAPAKMSTEAMEPVEERKQEAADSKLCLSSATRRAGQFKCVGAIRKAGFLSVKKWIIKRRQSIELARKQGWKRYWVCLRGAALLFHSVLEGRPACEQAEQQQIDLLSWIESNCSGQVQLVANLLQSEQQSDSSRDAFLQSIAQCYIEREPRHLIIIDGSIAQPIPEHPRRDFVFCLSTTFGDAYLFQASCQLEADNWIAAIHNACAGSIARDLTRHEAVKLFETKIRHFELEADKKIFLRQRLESRLASMSSMCHSSRRLAGEPSDEPERCADSASRDHKSKLTMRKLLQQLQQQLLALDTYIEQLHCEVYQLRCYLSSCGAQNLFYQNAHKAEGGPKMGLGGELPHPKSLLMHVSKATKLLLIKLGIFTVSSFHALMHARQDSAKSILQQIQWSAPSDGPAADCSSPLELRIRSHSISETLLFASTTDKAKLESATEDLLEMANFKTVSVLVRKQLAARIKRQEDESRLLPTLSLELSSDDRCSIQDLDESLCLRLKVNPSATSSSIVRQALRVLEPGLGPFEYLDYWLRLASPDDQSTGADSETRAGTRGHFRDVIKRGETVEEWRNCAHIELVEKIIFRVELARSRTNEEAATPFGISVEGQLFSAKSESQLNVYCNYIEWGSAADKAGLRDEDELLLLNGVPVAELDLMFVECLLQEANKLRAVVRSSRLECPPRGRQLDMSTWRSLDGDDGGDRRQEGARQQHNSNVLRDMSNQRTSGNFESAGSQVISDEYLSSLVCPPPPAKCASALLAPDSPIKRQKSDLGLGATAGLRAPFESAMSKSRSQHQMDATLESELSVSETRGASRAGLEARVGASSSAELARQLIQKTERLSRLLGREPGAELDRLSLNVHLSTSSAGSARPADSANGCQRLRRSILELVETEYAYIKHLETICEHYMEPLEENDFLNIADLRAFNQIVLDVLCLQHHFFQRLSGSIGAACHLDTKQLAATSDEFERLNRIVQLAESLNTPAAFRPIVEAIAQVFVSESERFKIYASYCVAYSKLQRILHPKRPSGATKPRGPSISSIPSSLNTFSTSFHSNSLTASLAPFHAQQRDSRLVSLGESSQWSEQGALLRQLSEFLANLDSSSSSASLSLAKSSQAEPGQGRAGGAKIAPAITESQGRPTGGSASECSSASTQKNVHQQNFESYLIKPIQRLVKYPMLLNSIALALQAHQNGAEASSIEPDSSSLLQGAISQMECAVKQVNDAQRVHDEYGATLDRIEAQFFAQHALEGTRNNAANLFGPHQPPISLDIAQLLHWGPVSWLNVAEFSSKAKKQQQRQQQPLSSMAFVFASCVVFIAKEAAKPAKRSKAPLRQSAQLNGQQAGADSRALAAGLSGQPSEWAGQEVVRYQTLIPVSEVQVRAVAQERQLNPSAGFEWELFQCSSSSSNSGLLSKSSAAAAAKREQSAPSRSASGRRYLLSSESNEARNIFLRKIRFTIRESVRNMSLPLGRSPTSKSLELKKLSTSSATSVNSNTNAHSSLSQATSLSPGEPDEGRDSATGRESGACPAFVEPARQAARFESAIGINS